MYKRTAIETQRIRKKQWRLQPGDMVHITTRPGLFQIISIDWIHGYVHVHIKSTVGRSDYTHFWTYVENVILAGGKWNKF